MRRVRLRPEFAWPYSRLKPDQWYTVREPGQLAEHPEWLWIIGDVHPEYVYALHFEIEGEEPNDAPAREARLRPQFASQYPTLQAGIWLCARQLLQQLNLPGEPPVAERRIQRLPAEHFEFRDPARHADGH